MSGLLDVLGECEEEISRAYTGRLRQTDCPALNCPSLNCPSLNCPAILQALVACCHGDDQPTPQAWAEALRNDAAGGELSLSDLLAALNCLERAVRLQIVERVDRKTALMPMLSELADAIDRLRRCYVVSAPPASAREKLLQRSNRQLEQFAYVASHDLQEPLRKILAFGDRLQRRCSKQLDETGRECVERMQSAAGRMQTLIEGLLTLSRVTTRQETFERVDLDTVAREVVSSLEVQIARTGGRVELGKLPVVEADPVQMRQLLKNLIANALKFRRDDVPPVVKVHGHYVQDRRQECRILVEDNGIGFEEKHLQRVFEIFARLHSRDAYEGTGIGLPICRKIVERHGGSISARSTPGKGSAFEVILPVIPPKLSDD